MDAAQELSPGRVVGYTDDGRPKLSARAKCRRVRVDFGGVELRVNGDRANFANLATCRSVWECPCCSRRVRSEQAEIVRKTVELWRESGGRCYLATFTIRHEVRGGEAHHSLEEMSARLAKAWQRLQRGRSWRTWSRTHQIEMVRSIELTWGEKHGFHPHIHAVIFVPSPIDLSAATDWLHAHWSAAVERAFGAKRWCPSRAHGTDLRDLQVEDYIVKLGAELTDPSGSKTARKGRLTPWEILERAATGDPFYVDVWRDYCLGMRGHRFLTWSVDRTPERLGGLRHHRETAELLVELDRQAESETETVVEVITPQEWRALSRLPDFRCEVLLAAVKGRAAVLEVLREFYELRDSLPVDTG